MPILLEDWLLFAFFCVSVVLYVLVLITLIVNRKNELLNGPFFMMTIHLGVAELIATLNNWLFVKPRMMGIFYDFYSSLDPVASRVANYVSWLMPSCSLMLTSLITANRFTSIVWPIKAIKFWNQRFVRISLAVAWLLGFASSSPMIVWSNGDFVKINGTMMLSYYYPEKMGQAYFIASVEGFPLNILQVLAYTVIFFTALRYSKVRATQPGHSNVFSIQLKLAITACITSVNQALVLVFTTLASAGGDYFNIYYFIYKIAIDIFNQSNPYLLLVCSTPLREALLKLIGCTKKQSNFIIMQTQQRKSTIIHTQERKHTVVEAPQRKPSQALSLRNAVVTVHF